MLSYKSNSDNRPRGKTEKKGSIQVSFQLTLNIAASAWKAKEISNHAPLILSYKLVL